MKSRKWDIGVDFLGVFASSNESRMERTMIIKRRVLACILLLVLVLMSACGPIMSTSRRSDAEEALAKAKAVNADVLAPYEYTMSQEYLRKADELWGYSEFGYSSEYAQKSIDMAKAAEEKAKQEPWYSPLEKQ